ncbi:hypothetical protein ACOBQX_03620 [Actinokineospora sp. G85]|uniref:hypothetical protein n=1 Tax=Actinokineospora sp. G85 TaxID=3406626 RepID=UPI003C78570E
MMAKAATGVLAAPQEALAVAWDRAPRSPAADSGDLRGAGPLGLTAPTRLAQVMPQWLVASYAAAYVGVAQAAVDAAGAHLRARGLTGLPAVRARVGRADAASASRRGHPLERLHRGTLRPATSDLGAAALGDGPHGDAAVPRW